ncbi:hypothetical protein B0T19DRAFT_434426 [Cercophora scortea]|uniref:Uncharacterized protein n=1 Tax=Cercophora scortea TaxID=314031 RepID=A0AAE0I2R0_9PEZI|nr:hypothetical protein B0T19DRAFT_434426 [Cercophora scortea]
MCNAGSVMYGIVLLCGSPRPTDSNWTNTQARLKGDWRRTSLGNMAMVKQQDTPSQDSQCLNGGVREARKGRRGKEFG